MLVYIDNNVNNNIYNAVTTLVHRQRKNFVWMGSTVVAGICYRKVEKGPRLWSEIIRPPSQHISITSRYIRLSSLTFVIVKTKLETTLKITIQQEVNKCGL